MSDSPRSGALGSGNQSPPASCRGGAFGRGGSRGIVKARSIRLVAGDDDLTSTPELGMLPLTEPTLKRREALSAQGLSGRARAVSSGRPVTGIRAFFSDKSPSLFNVGRHGCRRPARRFVPEPQH